MPPAGFKPAISAGERLQAHALDRSATGIGTTTTATTTTTTAATTTTNNNTKYYDFCNTYALEIPSSCI